MKNCPFCGGKAVFQRDGGSYGYYSPTIWIACENSIFPKDTCNAETRHLATEEWKAGKGTYSIEEQVKQKIIEMWNRRS